MANLKELETSLRGVGDEARKTGKELDQLANSNESAAESATDMRARLDMQRQQMSLVRTAALDLASALDKDLPTAWQKNIKGASLATAAITDVRDISQQAEGQLAKLGIKSNDVGAGFGKGTSGAQKFQAGMALLGPVLNTFTTSYTATQKVLAATGWDKEIEKLGLVEKGFRAIGLALDDLGPNTANVSAQMKMVRKAMEQFPEEMAKAKTAEERVTLATQLLGKAANETATSLGKLKLSLPSETFKSAEETAKNLGLGMESLLGTTNQLTGNFYTQEEAMAILGPEVDKYVETLKAVPGATKEVEGKTVILDAALGKHGESLKAIIKLNQELKDARTAETEATEKQKAITDQLTGAYKESFDAMAKNAGMTQEAATAYAESLLETQKWEDSSKSAADAADDAAESIEGEGEAAEEATEKKRGLAESEDEVAGAFGEMGSGTGRPSLGGSGDSFFVPKGEDEIIDYSGQMSDETAAMFSKASRRGGRERRRVSARKQIRKGGSGVYSTGAATIGLPTELRDISGRKSSAGSRLAAYGAGGVSVQGPGSGPDMGGELSLAGGVGDAETGGDVVTGSAATPGQSLEGQYGDVGPRQNYDTGGVSLADQSAAAGFPAGADVLRGEGVGPQMNPAERSAYDASRSGPSQVLPTPPSSSMAATNDTLQTLNRLDLIYEALLQQNIP